MNIKRVKKIIFGMYFLYLLKNFMFFITNGKVKIGSEAVNRRVGKIRFRFDTARFSDVRNGQICPPTKATIHKERTARVTSVRAALVEREVLFPCFSFRFLKN